jgi:hypothetical protein
MYYILDLLNELRKKKKKNGSDCAMFSGFLWFALMRKCVMQSNQSKAGNERWPSKKNFPRL